MPVFKCTFYPVNVVCFVAQGGLLCGSLSKGLSVTELEPPATAAYATTAEQIH